MKTNIKALQLVEKGLSSKTISNLTESQIDILHKKMIGEQATNPKIAAKIKELDLLNQKVGEVGAKMKNIGLEEKEIDEDDTLNVVNDPDATEDGMGIFEEDKNIAKASSICHSQVGPKKSRKWERCVKEVKKQLK